MKQVILTEDNLFKKNWKGVETCCFCNNKETIQHLFFIIMWHILFGEWFRLLLVYDHQKTQKNFLGLGKDKQTLNCDPKFVWEQVQLFGLFG